MLTIWKYPLALTDRQEIELPAIHRTLSAQFQFGTLQLWVMVDKNDTDKGKTVIEIYGTGHDIDGDEGLVHISTVQEEGGSLVWHVFERQR